MHLFGGTLGLEATEYRKVERHRLRILAKWRDQARRVKEAQEAEERAARNRGRR